MIANDGVGEHPADGEIAVPAVPAPGFSGTNTQELDVDEGDVVETDGAERSIAYGDVATARTVFVWEKGEKPGKTA